VGSGFTRRRFVGAAALGVPALLAGASSLRLTREDQERFLQNAEILSMRTLSEGITNSKRATLRDGALTHDAHVQSVDEYKPIYKTATQTYLNFADTFRHNLAAYELDKFLNIGMIPACVERKVRGETAAVTWWVDDVQMSEKDRYLKQIKPPDQDGWNRQIYVVRVFDELIYNFDRNLANLLITKSWRLWMIDHTRAFLTYEQLSDVKRLVRCDRNLLDGMRGLTFEALERALGKYIDKMRVKGLLARRDRIVDHFEEEVRNKGEVSVLYDFLPLDPTVTLTASMA